MAKEVITAKTSDDEGNVLGPISVDYDLDKALDDAGPDVERGIAKAGLIISLQDVIRGGLRAGKTKGDVQKDITAHVPGVKKRGKSKAEKMKDDFDKLSGEEKKALLASWQSGGGGE